MRTIGPGAGSSLQAYQRGAVVVLLVAVLMVLVGMAGLALEAGQLFNRRAEVQSLTEALALAAARQLNGSASGVSAALTAASERLSSSDGLRYQYGRTQASWNAAALSFAATAHGPWLDASTAASAPQGLAYVKVDPFQLETALTQLPTVFMRALSATLALVPVGAPSVAGPASINVLPLGICAMSPQSAAARGTELVQYGFRRGVSYDLMKLDPADTDGVGAHYLIDPVAAPGTSGMPDDFMLDAVKPFVCSGTLAMGRVTGGALTVQGPFPLAALYAQLNSRFGQYTAPCNSTSAPPDANVKAYSVSTFFNTAASWMNVSVPALSAQAAVSYPVTPSGSSEALWTYADPATLPPNTGPDKYGPLWSYARAVPFSAYVAGDAEPVSGYATYSATQANWTLLYPVNSGGGVPSLKTAAYPSGAAATPYLATTGNFFAAPSAGAPGQRGRRILNVALLRCPVPATGISTASVLAVGKFFMTVPANSSHLYAEFAGIAAEQTLSGTLEILQ
ncbi:pilus assembly protein TadG-related protein [Pseudoduganella danionis]|uniref:Pilus assembly protein TadE n=1 Tax=Pseudoduganella danionis TaxID=1890295 RepID=A0ABW9SQ41_9BURK|nr:pilus assembly protein TadG-related protein [Pseudoduganella danionis]MTW34283.1 pilus assembly protein TadE [Pseudoduganella danionis]